MIIDGPPRSCADEIIGVCPCGFDGQEVINCKYSNNMTLEEAASHLNDSCRISREIARLLWRCNDYTGSFGR